MKKIILILVLVLVVATSAVLCVSCAKAPSKYKNEMVNFTVVNQTGKNVTEIAMNDNRSEYSMVAKPQEGGLPDGGSIAFSMIAATENNAPSLMFSFTVEGGDSCGGSVLQKEGTITLVNNADGLGFDVSVPAK